MNSVDFCRGWTYRIWGIPGDTPVTLPHDYSQHLPRRADSKAGSAGGWFQGANIIYDHDLQVTEEMPGQRVMLAFDGVFPNAEVYLDDALLVRQPYGYLSFLADLTGRLRPGTQRIRVNVHGDALPGSRWYTGTGICRPVRLLTGPMASMLPDGLHVRTHREGPDTWTLETEIRFFPEAARSGCSLRLRVLDPDGAAVRETEQPVDDDRMLLRESIRQVRAWSPDDPALYTIIAGLYRGTEVLDTQEVSFGFREVRLDPERGLVLNGRPVKLRGGCVHHDNGLLGAVSLPEAEYRKARLLKDSGFNAVRCAHNPPAPAFLDACDRLGLLVMDEFTDVWNIGKNPYDYHLWFRERWREDLCAMVRRDWNHPSVILWSIGNEIPERDGSGDGYALCRQMCEAVRTLDESLLVTSALNNIGKRRLDMLDANVQTDDPDSIDYFGALSGRFLDPLDVAGYNYLARRYEKDLAAWPDRFLCGTESVAQEALVCWRKTLAHPRVIGDFAWAAIDYLGEAGIGHVWRKPEDGEGYFERWPWRQANCADMDLCGQMNPAGDYRRAVWGTLPGPRIAVQHPKHYHDDGEVSYWAWPERHAAWDYPGFEGKPVQVDVYSAAREITLRLNGKAIATNPCMDCVAVFDLTYAPGVLEAVDDTGARTVLHTPGRAARLALRTEAVGSLVFVTAEIQDADGVPCHFDGREIRFRVDGGQLLAAGSADPASDEGFLQGGARAWKGCASAVIARECGPLRITASAEGLPDAQRTEDRRAY